MSKLNKLEYFISYLYYDSNPYVAEVAYLYLACKDVVLGDGCIGVFIPVSVVKLSFRGILVFVPV
jgi:hypothetical protein